MDARQATEDRRLTPDPYDRMVGDYHWVHDDAALHRGTTTPGIRWALRALAPGAPVLDAACGTGLDAVALARRGFRVTASDTSEAMVHATRRAVAGVGLDVPVVRCSWDRLAPEFGTERFDAVLCTGNSLPHLPPDRVPEALAAFCSVLVPGGALILDTHNWEHVLAEGDRTVEDPVPRRRGGTTCRVRHVWRVPDGAEDPRCHLRTELHLRRTDGPALQEPEVSSLEVSFHPFTLANLLGWLEPRFVLRYCDADPAVDRYTVVAERRPGAPSAPSRCSSPSAS